MCRLVHKQLKLPTPQRLLLSASWQVGIYPLHTILVHLVSRLRDSQGDAELHYISCQFRQRTRDLLEPLWRFINTSVLFLSYRWPVCFPSRARGSAPASLSSPSAIPVVAGGAVMACLILRFTRSLGTARLPSWAETCEVNTAKLLCNLAARKPWPHPKAPGPHSWASIPSRSVTTKSR